MKNEFNTYNINNPDGQSMKKLGEEKNFFQNDDPRYVREDSSFGQDEANQISEVYDNWQEAPKNETANHSGFDPSASASLAPTVTTFASSIGGGVGALLGVIGTSVVAAAIVVVAFISTLSINLSLVMANFNSLVFQVEMTGAQEEDFQTRIYAVLTSDDGTEQQQDIWQETQYLTFYNLSPGTEYRIIIRNEEKVFVEKTYFTASEQEEDCYLSAESDGRIVWVFAECPELQSGEYYTLIAKTERGKTVFAEDFTPESERRNNRYDEEYDEYYDEYNEEYYEERFFQFEFEIPEGIKQLFLTLSIGGRVRAVVQVEIWYEPDDPRPDDRDAQYDFENGAWIWGSDYTWAQVSFADLNGGQPLILGATVVDESNYPTCEEPGLAAYRAFVEYGGREFSDWTEFQLEALGHDFSEWNEEQEPTDEEPGVRGHYYCYRCDKYFDAEFNEIPEEDLELSYNPDNEEDNEEVRLSVGDGIIQIRPSDYYTQSSDSEDYMQFVTSSNNPIVIYGTSKGQYTPIEVLNFTGSYQDREGRGLGEKATIYLVFEDLIVESSEWPIITIFVDHDLDLYITNRGETSIRYDYAAIRVQPVSYDQKPKVNIYVTDEDSSSSFNLNSQNKDAQIFESTQGVSANLYYNRQLLGSIGNSN